LFGNRRANLPRSRYFNATAIGYLVTNIFPLRLGELARIFFIARDRKQTYGLATSTVVVEHVLDVLVVLGILIVIVMTGSLPRARLGSAGRSHLRRAVRRRARRHAAHGLAAPPGLAAG